MTTDLDHKFELAVDLRHMSIAHAVLIEATAKVSVCSRKGNCFCLISLLSYHDNLSDFIRCAEFYVISAKHDVYILFLI